MEITVNIPKNDYIQPTEVRQEVVQAICKAFLKGLPYYSATRKHVLKTGYFVEETDGYRIHGTEIKAAFAALLKAGYHIYAAFECGKGHVYRCSGKPEYIDRYGIKWKEVTEFTDFID